MKKILLGTTGLVGAALIASAASAETPKVTLGGFSDFQAGFVDQDLDGAGAVKDFSFRNDNEITVRVDAKTDAGLGYGAVIDLEADTTQDADNQGLNASRTFTYLEGGFGRVELGGNKSVASTMRVDASSVAVATGGINGAWIYFTTTPTDGFVSTSKLMTEHGDTDAYGDESQYNATKISYYTPNYSGFQAGVSFTPGIDGDNGRGQNVALNTQTGYNDVIDLGLGYTTTMGDVSLAVAGTYETATNNAISDTADGFNVGANVGYMGFQLAGSYGEWTDAVDSGANAAAGGSDADYYTVGLGYDVGAFGLSATYLDSSLDVTGGENEFTNLVLGADYKLAPGLTPYAEISLFDADSVTNANDNEGTAVILGTQVAF